MIDQPPISLCFYNRYTGVISKAPIQLGRIFKAIETLETSRSGLVWLEQCDRKFFDRLCHRPEDLEAVKQAREEFARERGWIS